MGTEHSWILKRTAIMPNKIALIDIDSERSWTYQLLSDEIYKWLAFFKTMGLQKNDRVAVIAENRIDLFAILFACGIGGYIYVPLNWRLSEAELNYILEDCTPTLLIYEDRFISIVSRNSHIKAHPINEELPIGKNNIDNNGNNSEDAWLLIYTGGTTGKPKGVVISYKAVNWNAFNTIISWNLSSDDCTLNYMPLFHTGGLNALSIPILMVGGTVVVGKKFNPQEAVKALNKYKTTISLFVPTMYQAIIKTEDFQRTTFPTVKVFLSGGSPCPLTIYNAFQQKGLSFKEGYGLTEAGPNNFVIHPEVAAKKRGSVGKTMQFNQIKILDSEGKECEVDEIGELFISGNHVFTEYWKNQEETAKVKKNGWLRTGDLAKQDRDGDIYIIGRIKEMIITGGENVYPQEVEQCIITHPKVLEVAVVGTPDLHWGEVVTAFIVGKNNFNNIEEIQEHCRNFLGGYKIPRRIFFVAALPKTHVGKIDKKRLLMNT